MRHTTRYALFCSAILPVFASGCTRDPAGAQAAGSPAVETAPAARAAPVHSNESGIDRSPAAKWGPGIEGARGLLSAFLDPGTDRMALTLALRPEPEDYAAVFTAEIVSEIRTNFEARWRTPEEFRAEPRNAIAGNEGQTELLLSSATAQDLNTRSPASERFPGGYAELQGKFIDGVDWYRWKFVEPGAEIGMAFDGLVHVNGRWVWFPKPWRAIELPGPTKN